MFYPTSTFCCLSEQKKKITLRLRPNDYLRKTIYVGKPVISLFPINYAKQTDVSDCGLMAPANGGWDYIQTWKQQQEDLEMRFVSDLLKKCNHFIAQISSYP
ncbi:hypothetical protein XENORESO_007347 [Xenotaenia resolanae]|uniref:Uncharacterized protein n=1 Tax=Xenotaenia resolanae TaxID=208358 RepID=A0ABV0WSP8_9TELE